MHLPFPLQLKPSQSSTLISHTLPVKPWSHVQTYWSTPSTQCLFSPQTTPTQLSWQDTGWLHTQLGPWHQILQRWLNQCSAHVTTALIVRFDCPRGPVNGAGVISTPSWTLLIDRLSWASLSMIVSSGSDWFWYCAATLTCAPCKNYRRHDQQSMFETKVINIAGKSKIRFYVSM